MVSEPSNGNNSIVFRPTSVMELTSRVGKSTRLHTSLGRKTLDIVFGSVDIKYGKMSLSNAKLAMSLKVTQPTKEYPYDHLEISKVSIKFTGLLAGVRQAFMQAVVGKVLTYKKIKQIGTVYCNTALIHNMHLDYLGVPTAHPHSLLFSRRSLEREVDLDLDPPIIFPDAAKYKPDDPSAMYIWIQNGYVRMKMGGGATGYASEISFTASLATMSMTLGHWPEMGQDAAGKGAAYVLNSIAKLTQFSSESKLKKLSMEASKLGDGWLLKFDMKSLGDKGVLDALLDENAFMDLMDPKRKDDRELDEIEAAASAKKRERQEERNNICPQVMQGLCPALMPQTPKECSKPFKA